ncbi:unnamed protein product [Diamesa hyperborea]
MVMQINTSAKQPSLAIEFKLKGTQYFAEGDYWKALLFFNKALCNAATGSAAIGIIYACRSAVYIEMDLFPECLQNIQLARENNIPDHQLLELKTREEKCLELMSNMTTSTQWH